MELMLYNTGKNASTFTKICGCKLAESGNSSCSADMCFQSIRHIKLAIITKVQIMREIKIYL
jgi:hypothetical protein